MKLLERTTGNKSVIKYAAREFSFISQNKSMIQVRKICNDVFKSFLVSVDEYRRSIRNEVELFCKELQIYSSIIKVDLKDCRVFKISKLDSPDKNIELINRIQKGISKVMSTGHCLDLSLEIDVTGADIYIIDDTVLDIRNLFDKILKSTYTTLFESIGLKIDFRGRLDFDRINTTYLLKLVGCIIGVIQNNKNAVIGELIICEEKNANNTFRVRIRYKSYEDFLHKPLEGLGSLHCLIFKFDNSMSLKANLLLFKDIIKDYK